MCFARKFLVQHRLPQKLNSGIKKVTGISLVTGDEDHNNNKTQTYHLTQYEGNLIYTTHTFPISEEKCKQYLILTSSEIKKGGRRKAFLIVYN